MPLPDNEALFAIVRAWVQRHYPGRLAKRISLALDGGEKVRLPIPIAPASDGLARPPASEAFVPTPFQSAILDALDGRALRTDALGAAVGDRSRLFRRPGGLHELRERGYVERHSRLGYYRPDAPPEELEERQAPRDVPGEG